MTNLNEKSKEDSERRMLISIAGIVGFNEWHRLAKVSTKTLSKKIKNWDKMGYLKIHDKEKWKKKYSLTKNGNKHKRKIIREHNRNELFTPLTINDSLPVMKLLEEGKKQVSHGSLEVEHTFQDKATREAVQTDINEKVAPIMAEIFREYGICSGAATIVTRDWDKLTKKEKRKLKKS